VLLVPRANLYFFDILRTPKFPGGPMSDSAETYDLECRNLVRRYGSFTAVDNVSFGVPQGDFFSILGPSGCGKTTLSRLAAGLETVQDGRVYLQGKMVARGKDGVCLAPEKRGTAVAFQD